ncbi:hypothetical protein [Paramuribaculum intestinale]|uniref:hypothetical protein n=1 Tax=Paramuribaculum intestinale TaxID=2094151 RepID=UPI0025A9FFE5|nr:hypothetical protein [Paramuribaculum intestinale]
MTYLEILNRMAVLGDVLTLKLPAKAMAETLRLRAHYAKGVKEWTTIAEQINKDTAPAEGKERDEEQQKQYDEVLQAKAAEDAELKDRRYTPEAFEQLCEVTSDKDMMLSALARDKEGKPGEIPAVAWLDYVAANLVEE